MIERDLLLVTPDFSPSRGGVARYLGLFAEYFHERITVIAPVRTEGTDAVNSFLLKRQALLFRIVWPHWLKTVQLLVQQSNSYRCVIVSHVIPFGTAALFAKKITKKPYILIVHGMDVRLAMRSKKALLARVLSGAYLVVANSNALAQELQQSFVLSNILTVYPPMNPAMLPAEPPVRAVLSEFRLLSVSRLIERKGHDRVLQALAMLKLNGSLTSFKYTIIGDGPMRQALETLAIELEIDAHVIFKGEVSDEELKASYASTDLFVLPVKNDPIDKEGFGMVYIEAAAFGIPSIATNMNGVDEAVIQNETGILIKDGDIEELSRTIFQLSVDSELRARLGNAARTRVVTTFSPKQQFSKLEPYLV